MDGEGGGLEQVLRRWASWLSGRHEVVVVSHRRHGKVGAAEPYPTVSIRRTADLDAVLADMSPDVVGLHNRPQWARRCPPGAAVGVTFHNYPGAWKTPPGAMTAERGIPPALSAVSTALAAAAAARLGVVEQTVWVTPPSIDPVYFERRAWRPQPTVLCPHRLLRKKGVLDLLAVAQRPEFRSVTFAFADLISPWARPTAEHREMRAAVRSVANAVLFPALGAGELGERYATSSVVVCAVNEAEGLGLVALEAQACGVPVVTTDLGGLREATFPPNACVPARDGEALAAAIAAALCASPAGGRAAQRRSGGIRRRIEERHSIEAAGLAYERWLTFALTPAS